LISVIIPTLNEEKTIEATLKSLINQDYNGKYEIVIVDSNSEDKTIEIVSNFLRKNVKLFLENENNISNARNMGVKNSKGEIIAFIDAGRIAPKNWLRKIEDSFKENSIGGVGGTFKSKDNLNLFEKFTFLDKIYRSGFKKKYVDVVCTGNAAFSKKVINEVGGFDKRFAKRGENSDFCYRVSKKYKILYRPDIFVYYKDSINLRKFIKEHFLNGFYHFSLYLRHKEKMLGDDYGRFSLIVQSLIFLISLFLTLINPYFILFFISAFIILNIKFLKLIDRKEKFLLLTALILQILRIFSWIIGAGFGFIKLISNTIFNYLIENKLV
jgi:glycosyltransferase involved in cell wall biosynthesis